MLSYIADVALHAKSLTVGYAEIHFRVALFSLVSMTYQFGQPSRSQILYLESIAPCHLQLRDMDLNCAGSIMRYVQISLNLRENILVLDRTISSLNGFS